MSDKAAQIKHIEISGKFRLVFRKIRTPVESRGTCFEICFWFLRRRGEGIALYEVLGFAAVRCTDNAGVRSSGENQNT